MKNYLTRANDDWGWGFFENAFNDFFKPTLFNGCGTANLMKTDVKETDDAFELAVDLPGFDKQDLKLSLDDGYLTIEAKKEDKQEEKYLRRERSCSYKRSYYVGKQVTEEDVKAKYENGVLNVTVPKIQQKQLPKGNIQID